MYSDYYCLSCRKFFEYEKPYGVENFPDNPKCIYCCSTKTRRKISVNIVVPNDFKAVNTK